MDVGGLPFKIGQMAESKSFLAGYRSAWFRCMIKDICKRRGKIGFFLEFYDYPDEKIKWTQLYQKIPGSKGGRKELMVRPSYPCLYREREMSSEASTNVIVVVNDTWKVGHLVDWWCHNCYWSGKITTLLEEDKVLIELLKPPVGEGGSYEAFLKDLRPSLEWSSELGWILPSFKEIEGCCACASLVQPLGKELEPLGIKNAKETSDVLHYLVQSDQSTQDNVSTGHQPASPSMSHWSLLTSMGPPHSNGVIKETSDDSVDAMNINLVSSSLLPTIPSCSSAKPITMEGGFEQASERRDNREFEHTSQSRDHITTRHFSNKIKEIERISERGIGGEQADVSSSHGVIKETKILSGNNFRREDVCHKFPSKKMGIDRYESTNSAVHVDPVESSIMELEELANKLMWLNGLLKFGLNWSMEPSWKFKSD